MRKRIHSLVVLILAATLAPAAARPCTTFCLKVKDGGVFYGRNFDFPTGFGKIHVNPRGLKKTSLVNPRRSR